MQNSIIADQVAGIIFDFNGVLYWDSHLHERAWIRISEELRGNAFTASELQTHVHGRTNLHIVSYLAGGRMTEREIASCIDRKEQMYRELCVQEANDLQLSEGAVAVLDVLAANDFPRAIATSSPPDNVAFFREHLGLDTWFAPDTIICDDGSLPGKPAPDIYRRVAQRLGLLPRQCLVVEDSVSGLTAALAAGIGWVVALAPPEAPALASLSGQLSAQISSLAELPAMLAPLGLSHIFGLPRGDAAHALRLQQ